MRDIFHINSDEEMLHTNGFRERERKVITHVTLESVERIATNNGGVTELVADIWKSNCLQYYVLHLFLYILQSKEDEHEVKRRIIIQKETE